MGEVILASFHVVTRNEEEVEYCRIFKQTGVADACWPQVGGVEELNSPDEGWVKVLSKIILPSYYIVVRSEEDELYSRTFKQPGITDA